MPSFTIHLAIADEYMKKHPGEITNKEDFIYGTIAPDLTREKSITHYYGNTDLNPIDFREYFRAQYDASDFHKGYFLHLISDEIFYLIEYGIEYKRDVAGVHTNLYDDYYYINKELREKYNINNFPYEIEMFGEIKEGFAKYLDVDRVCNFIDKVSNVAINDQIKYFKKHRKLIYDIDKDNINYNNYHRVPTLAERLQKRDLNRYNNRHNFNLYISRKDYDPKVQDKEEIKDEILRDKEIEREIKENKKFHRNEK